jgi:hypothetical protein
MFTPITHGSVVAELNERDWSVIARTNCLLSGQRLAFSEGLKGIITPTVERTPFSGKFSFLSIISVTDPDVIQQPSRSKVAISTPTKSSLLRYPRKI